MVIEVFYGKNYKIIQWNMGQLVKLVNGMELLWLLWNMEYYKYSCKWELWWKMNQGENVYINTDTVLPNNPKVLSNSFGSLWEIL